MRAIRTFAISSTLPPELSGLRDLALNLRWSWDHDTVELFRSLDPEGWAACEHNPTLFLARVDQGRLDAAAEDQGFRSRLQHVSERFEAYMNEATTWFQREFGGRDLASNTTPLIAYFSAEFGLTEIIPIFAGGLGILAGDHVKSSSDLGVPLIGVGLLYQTGYFRQRIDAYGVQHAIPRENDFETLPVTLERGVDGSPVLVQIELPGRPVFAQIWRAQVGRAAVYMLDANLDINEEKDRNITARLYDADPRMRIKQEMLLGIGGVRALRALGIDPPVIHLNEGHAAFATLERIRMLIAEHELSFEEARQAAVAGTVFTTHTPVAAGHDRFPAAILDYYFNEYWQQIGLNRQEFLALGRENPDDDNEPFTMTVLAMRLSSWRGGVSRLHGEVTRGMWQPLWPSVPEHEIPISHVTNGVHLTSWLSADMCQLYDKYIDGHWRDAPPDPETWRRIDDIPDHTLWEMHDHNRRELVAFARDRLAQQLRRRGSYPAEIAAVETILDPDALTIGFARRFATYKRGTLLLRDRERLARIITNSQRPVQFIFAGKAHPDDEAGKEVIRELVNAIQEQPFRRHMIFIEDYDIAVARWMVQGVDVWLNNPRRPLEASGTSGMKVAANGGLNLSTLDGWWDEAIDFAAELGEHIGWVIGDRTNYDDQEYGDEGDARYFYNILEYEIVPRFYDRDAEGLPRGWIEMMRTSMRLLAPRFNTHRMLDEYTRQYYVPAIEASRRRQAHELAEAREVASWLQRVRASWHDVRIRDTSAPQPNHVLAGERVTIHAQAELAALDPDDVRVELVWGSVDEVGTFHESNVTEMAQIGTADDGTVEYMAEISTPGSGRLGYTIRILPSHPALLHPLDSGLIRWANEAGS